MDKIVRVNMTDLSAKIEGLPEKYTHLGGRALTSQIVYHEVPPTCNPLGRNNKVVLACGLMAGLNVSSANRLSVGAKSPLTGGIKEANAGGVAAYKMARLGVRSIVVEGLGQGENWYLLLLNKEGASLQPANHLAGLGIYEKANRIKEQFGPKVGMVLIGPGGEQLMLSAGVTNNDPEGVPSRYAARGGLGAVLGSKKLLGIVLDDEGCRTEPPVNKDEFTACLKQYHQVIRETPQTAEIFPKYGTPAMVSNTNAIGGLPTRNFSTGTFEGADKINGEAVYNTITSRGGEGNTSHSCMPGCVIRCSNVYPGPDGKVLVSPLEYETIALVGSNCCIDDLDAIARINYLCNDYGVDTLEIGTALAIAMEAGVLPYGDAVKAVALVEEIGKNSVIGRVLGAGAEAAGKVLGIHKVPVVKGQAMAAYEPRSVKGLGVTYMTSPMGADHTAGNTIRSGLKHHLKDGQVNASLNGQVGAYVMDLLGLCLMVGAAVKDMNLIAGLVSARLGREIKKEDLLAFARESLEIEKAFNRKAGFTEAHDRLPEHFYEEPNPASGCVFDITDEDLKST